MSRPQPEYNYCTILAGLTMLFWVLLNRECAASMLRSWLCQHGRLSIVKTTDEKNENWLRIVNDVIVLVDIKLLVWSQKTLNWVTKWETLVPLQYASYCSEPLQHNTELGLTNNAQQHGDQERLKTASALDALSTLCKACEQTASCKSLHLLTLSMAQR